MKEAVFDGDPLTFYDAKEAIGAWAGLDFGEPKQITSIHYIFRNDDNSIRIDDEYELFYWDNNKWATLGKRIAQSDTLNFSKCPQNALFLLHNHSRGKEERIFTYENGKQVWW